MYVCVCVYICALYRYEFCANRSYWLEFAPSPDTLLSTWLAWCQPSPLGRHSANSWDAFVTYSTGLTYFGPTWGIYAIALHSTSASGRMAWMHGRKRSRSWRARWSMRCLQSRL